MNILLISLILLPIIILHSSADQNLIETTCKNTPNYPLCTTTLHAHRSSATADVTGLALIIVQGVKDRTRAAISAANNLKRTAHPKLSQALQECARVYDAVLVADVPVAVEALTKGDPKFAENGMADTAVEADICEEGIEKAVGKAWPMRRENKAVGELAQVARAIIRNLL